MKKELNKLSTWFCSADKLFSRFSHHVIDGNNPTKRRIFIDRQSDVLFVAHVDTVKIPLMIKQTKNRFWARGLDDRLGCFAAYILGKELKCDVLFCDLEETGLSTGQYQTLKDYNWIVEFDRAGNDVVTYDKDNQQFREALNSFWKIGFGSFSDISILDTEKCCFNLGIGYFHAHSDDSYFDKKIFRSQIEKFRGFFELYKNTDFGKHDPLPIYKPFDWQKNNYGYSYDYDRNYQNYNSYQSEVCDFCGFQQGKEIYGYCICEDCFEAMVNQLQNR